MSFGSKDCFFEFELEQLLEPLLEQLQRRITKGAILSFNYVGAVDYAQNATSDGSWFAAGPPVNTWWSRVQRRWQE